jgi:GNAT superfamily N-acetyltransferase
VSVTIDTARAADAEELARMRHALYDEYGDADLPIEDYVGRFAAFVRNALEDPRWMICVARADGQLVATMWLQLVGRVPQPVAHNGSRPIGYLTNVYVDPAHRDAGIGARMLHTVRDWARAADVSTILCWPAPSDAAERFYARGGFHRNGSPMVLDVTR